GGWVARRKDPEEAVLSALGNSPKRSCVQHCSPADSHDRRKLPDDETITRQQQDGVIQTQLRKCSLPRPDLLFVVERDGGNRFGSVGMQVHPCAVLKRSRRRQKRERYVEAIA